MPAWYVKCEDIASKSLLVIITILVFIAAVSRTIGYPVIWSDDMAQLLFVWLCVLGATRAMRKKAHIGVDLLVKRLTRSPRWLLEVFNTALVVGFLLTLAISGYRLTMLNWERIYGDSGISYAWVTIAIPVGCALMIVEVIAHFLRSVRGRQLVFYSGRGDDLDRSHSQLG
jgi:TRAP-type C4-dicarboxylate transport system permease small subunit